MILWDFKKKKLRSYQRTLFNLFLMKRSHSTMSRSLSLSLVIDRQTSFTSNSGNITDNNMFTPKCSVDDIENPFVKRLMTRRQARIKTPFEQEIETDPLLRCCVPLLCLPCRFQSRLLSCLFFCSWQSKTKLSTFPSAWLFNCFSGCLDTDCDVGLTHSFDSHEERKVVIYNESL